MKATIRFKRTSGWCLGHVRVFWVLSVAFLLHGGSDDRSGGILTNSQMVWERTTPIRESWSAFTAFVTAFERHKNNVRPGAKILLYIERCDAIVADGAMRDRKGEKESILR